ncbi:MAG: PaaI family thioesterase [Paracoccaceae bacterium]|nr:PaaI family thioesterase [Paracoccaceae bacterium]
MDHKINTSVLAKHLSMDYVLKNFCATSTYMKYLDIRFIKENNSYISVLPYKSNLIGNPDLKVLHGGITVALLEFTAMAQILYGNDNVTSSQGTNLSDNELDQPKAKVIDINVEYLRPGFAQDSFAIARIVRTGRRFAWLHVEAWQEGYKEIFAQASVHFSLRSK